MGVIRILRCSLLGTGYKSFSILRGTGIDLHTLATDAQQRRFSFFVIAQIMALLPDRVGCSSEKRPHALCRLWSWQRCGMCGISVVFSGHKLLSIIFRCNCLKWHPQPAGEPIDFILHDPT